jgi:hypothetical protein
VRWFIVLLPGGFLIMLALAIWEWHRARHNQPTRFADTRAMAERPVIVNGKPHHPRLRKLVA